MTSEQKEAAPAVPKRQGKDAHAEKSANESGAQLAEVKRGPKPKDHQAPATTLPTAEPARMKRRHWGLLASFLFAVLIPLLLVGGYLWGVADDRYGSVTGFTVREEEGQSSSDLMSGLAQFAGGNVSPDSDVLYEFIRSQNIVRRVDDKLDLRAHYGAYWKSDPVFALWPDATIEDLLWYWGRVVRVSYDRSTSLTQFEVSAYDAEMAQKIAQAIVEESQAMVNALNEAARTDAIRYSETQLVQAQDRLREARAALTEFRTRTQIVDLEADIQARMGVINTLQQQLAAELVIFDELSQTTQSNDPRITQTLRRIQVIRDRVTEERRAFATMDVMATGEDYPTLIAEFEGLQVDVVFAEETYRSALAARDVALDNAQRQSRYLATFVEPTLADSAEYPRRLVLFGLAALFLTLSWGILVLVYYSIRDRN